MSVVGSCSGIFFSCRCKPSDCCLGYESMPLCSDKLAKLTLQQPHRPENSLQKDQHDKRSAF